MSEHDATHDPFYQRVDPSVQCDTCEAVCCRLTVVLMPEDRVPRWLVQEDERGLQTLAKGEDGWCAAVDPLDFRCTIYADRPAICRKFAMGSPSCRHERAAWSAHRAVPTAVHTWDR
ncbi:YkgJ family cysteine cluster protein [Dyella sp.]|uniref:YkgJ family cysteine cluster protein n=1 Tax=Dyella sp. TaxID=1869338 RepID=UPI0039C86C29